MDMISLTMLPPFPKTAPMWGSSKPICMVMEMPSVVNVGADTPSGSTRGTEGLGREGYGVDERKDGV